MSEPKEPNLTLFLSLLYLKGLQSAALVTTAAAIKEEDQQAIERAYAVEQRIKDRIQDLIKHFEPTEPDVILSYSSLDFLLDCVLMNEVRSSEWQSLPKPKETKMVN